jgi:hypothetical protein
MRLVELATYLDISRPTLYKYLEEYESKEYINIDKRCYDLFTFIDNTKNCTRPIIMDYLINKILPIESITGSANDILSSVRKLSESPKELDLKKIKLIEVIAATTKFDEIIGDLLKLVQSTKKVTIQNIESILEEGE